MATCGFQFPWLIQNKYIYILFLILFVVEVVLGVMVVVKTFISSKICGYHSGNSENSSHVECDTVSQGD